MATDRLTDPQRRALEVLEEGDAMASNRTSRDGRTVNGASAWTLYERGLVDYFRFRGIPTYRITPTGRQALAQERADGE